MKQKEQNCWNKKELHGENALPAPVSGLNDNLEFMGKQLHIQTENAGFPAAGLAAARIVTQVFCGGRVVFSRKTDHPPNAADSGDTSDIRERMHSQHRQIIKELKDKQAQLKRHSSFL